MMFYNGFNLLIDIILSAIIFRFSYRAGWFKGYAQGEQDLQDYMERKADHVYDWAKEGL